MYFKKSGRIFAIDCSAAYDFRSRSFRWSLYCSARSYIVLLRRCAASLAFSLSMSSHDCLAMSRIISQSALAICDTVRVSVVCSGTLNASSAVSSLWLAIASETAAPVLEIFGITKFNRCFPLAGCLSFCVSPTSSQAVFQCDSSKLVLLECMSHRLLWIFGYPNTVVPRDNPSNTLSSVSKVSTVVIRPAQAACTISRLIEANSLCAPAFKSVPRSRSCGPKLRVGRVYSK